MNRNRYVLILIGVIIFAAIPIWLVFQHNEPQRFEGQSQVNPVVMDQVLAKDLSLTTKLFLDQLNSQLQRWSTYDLSKAEMKGKFEEELGEHPHFHSFALVRDKEISIAKGDIPEEKLTKLKELNQDYYYSDPYSRGDKQFLFIARKTKLNEWVVGEVDLSFVKKFVGEMASVADANGNFFISSGDTEVKWESEDKASKGRVTEEVEELGWQIVVQSDDTPSPLNQTHYKEGEAIVKLRPTITIETWLSEHPGLAIKKVSTPYYLLVHEGMGTEEFVRSLRADANVESAEPNYVYTKQAPVGNSANLPNDEFFEPYQWNLSQIKIEQGWDITGGAEDVIIAILDTGVDPDHQDLAEKMVEGYNAFDGSSNASDDHGHGTHVAGISSALTNNITGIAGVSWYNPIMPIKVLNENGEGGLFEISSGIRWATDHGAKVINMSLGDTEDSSMLHDAITYAYEQDVVLIAAAGNDNVSQPMYPASYTEVLSVAAVNQQLQKAAFSNFGQHIDVTAPGEHIPSLFPENQYVFMSGTSMASPHVAGFAGLIRSIRPELSNEEVFQLIRQTADDLGPEGHDPYFGYGQINVAKALEYIRNNNEIVFTQKQNREDINSHWLSSWIHRVNTRLSSY